MSESGARRKANSSDEKVRQPEGSNGPLDGRIAPMKALFDVTETIASSGVGVSDHRGPDYRPNFGRGEGGRGNRTHP